MPVVHTMYSVYINRVSGLREQLSPTLGTRESLSRAHTELKPRHSHTQVLYRIVYHATTLQPTFFIGIRAGFLLPRLVSARARTFQGCFG